MMEILKMNKTVQVHEWRSRSWREMEKPEKPTYIHLIDYDSDYQVFRYYHVYKSGVESSPYVIHYDNLNFTELFSFLEINSLAYM